MSAKLDSTATCAEAVTLGFVYEGRERYDEAVAAYLKYESLPGLSAARVQALQAAYRAGSTRAYWRKRCEQTKEKAKRDHAPAVTFGCLHNHLGEKEQALAWLDTVYHERSPQLGWPKAGRNWDPLRSDPYFRNLLRRAIFPQ